jgi:uncharacterized protein (DUF1499 family)
MNRTHFRWILAAFLVLLTLVLWKWLPRGERPSLGVSHGQLSPVPNSPNAVSSQSDSPRHRIDPFPWPIPNNPDASLAAVRLATLQENGMSQIEASPGYLRFEAVTPWLRFIDDLEWSVDTQARVIHVRSASRIGHSDLGANRARVERIRLRLFPTQTATDDETTKK